MKTQEAGSSWGNRWNLDQMLRIERLPETFDEFLMLQTLELVGNPILTKMRLQMHQKNGAGVGLQDAARLDYLTFHAILLRVQIV